MLPRVKSVKTIGNKMLRITFDNHEVRLFDVSKYLHYPVYEPLNNPVFFQKARALNGTVIWDENIDFAPETLYLESVPAEQVSEAKTNQSHASGE